MQLSTALTLLYVADRQDRQGGGLIPGDLVTLIGMPSATASRNALYWGQGYKEMPNAGYGLIEPTTDPTDARRKPLRLTHKGEAFIRRVEEVLENG